MYSRIIFFFLFSFGVDQALGQDLLYSNWSNKDSLYTIDKNSLNIIDEDLIRIQNDTLLVSVKIELLGHLMILTKDSLNEYKGYCYDYIIEEKEKSRRDVYIKYPINNDTVKYLLDWCISNRIDTLVSEKVINMRHDYLPMYKDGYPYILTIRFKNKVNEITFIETRDTPYKDPYLERLSEVQTIIDKLGNWKVKEEYLMKYPFRKGKYWINSTTQLSITE